MAKWLINGVPGNVISVMDRGLTYGDGLFETIAVREGTARFLDYHLERMTSGCRRLAIPPPSNTVVAGEVRDVAAGCGCGSVKVLLTRGIGERGYAAPADPATNRIVGLIPGERPSPDAYRDGIVLRMCETKIGENRRLAGMKTLGRLDQVLARSEWTDADIGEGLMTTEAGRIICGTMTNVFHVSEGRLYTPDLARCGIHGVMRRVVMEQARRLDIDCREVDVYQDDLSGASEIFVTNSNIGIWPVVQLESKRYEIGAVTRHLMAALAGLGVSECAV